MRTFTIILLCGCALLVLLVECEGRPKASPGTWHYPARLGHEKWSTEFPLCAGKHQSPIDLSPFSSEKDEKSFKPFIFSFFDAVPDQAVVINNGHSLEVDFALKMQPQLSGGSLKGTYLFTQFHLHWGVRDLQGSEHTVNSVRYPMELHMVHYKMDYDNFSEALNHDDGLAVLGIFFTLSPTDNPALAPLLSHLDAAHKTVGKQNVTDLYPLASMLPSDVENFYTYKGSLTTPPCNEVVTWTIFKETLPVSEAQLTLIRSLLDAQAHPLVNNYRDTQPLNDRTALRSF